MTSLSDAYVRFCNLLALAEECFATGDFAAAAKLAQIAARYAFPGHVGLFGSPQLERILLELGKQIPTTSICAGRKHDGNRRSILHVLSYGRPIGGDSRFAWRWMQEDRQSCHSVAITSQADLNGKFEVPEALIQAAEETGGFFRQLDASPSNPLDQARELRVLCQEMDIVALHVFPYDIIPILALSDGCDSVKTLFINHSDHTFWIGGSVAHSVVHLRNQRDNFLRDRRGLDPDRSSKLPTPLAYSPPSVTKAQAKHALNLELDTVLLLTIATPFKYSAPGFHGFLDLVTPVVTEISQAVLIAVGPKSEGAWLTDSLRTNGRIVPLGARWDNDLLYAAADVYLDSVPFSSITSLLEAGSHGTPLLGYRQSDPELELLGPGAPGLEGAMDLASDPESYRALLSFLISNEEYRLESGQRVKKQILSFHTGSHWRDALNGVYGKLYRIEARNCLLRTSDKFEASALNSALVHLYGPEPFSGLMALIRRYIRTLPYRSRLSLTWGLHDKGLGLCFWNLIPPPFDKIVYRTGGWAKRVMQRFLRLR
jgi:hypothetical protein